MNTHNSTTSRTIILVALCFHLASTGFAASSARFPNSQGKLKGKVVKNVYYSPEGDFRVAVPNAGVPGGSKMRDEGDKSGWQVIFTDDFGGFFRLIAMKNGIADVVLMMEVYADAFDKEVVESSVWGREIRFSHVEKEGAEITVSTSRRLPDGSFAWNTITPDLATANVVFVANDHMYHLIAGMPIVGDHTQQTAIEVSRKRLDKLLKGFEIITKSK